MNCPPVTTLEDAEKPLPNSLLPVQGLRRNAVGGLTDDAVRTVIDSLKSRGVDPREPSVKEDLQVQIAKLLCSANQQYQFLLKDLFERLTTQQQITVERLEVIKAKNQFMQDLLTVSRHIQSLTTHDQSGSFIEGWQNPGATPPSSPDQKGVMAKKLAEEHKMLESKKLTDLKESMIRSTTEKNLVASNYLGLFGFLNIVAVGLLLYIGGTK